MIGLDTNVLVRYLTQDDPAQSPRAVELMDRRLTEENPGFISIVVIVETVWVLERAYGATDPEIAAIVERLLQTSTLIVENEREVFLALAALQEGRASFADALIGALSGRAGCSVVLTFDRAAARLPLFELL